MEICESFGIVDELLREGCHNVEVTFWTADARGDIVKTRSSPATFPGLSHMPRVLLNQARFHGLMSEAMKRFNRQEVDYGYKVLDVKVDEESAKDVNAYPVTILTEKDGKEEKFKAKYAIGCDGAHSTVRRSLGFNMIGDVSDSVWGVMDVFPQTDFPDIRKQVVVQSDTGSIVNIPREGGALTRIYIELPPRTVAKDVKIEDLQAAARQIFIPYKLDFAGVFWWSAYSIGQRVANHFSKANRAFLAGDACHTHSPKAGQGMNISLQDGYNIGWKLASILKKQVRPDLLETYNIEREKVANNLINFDRVWAKQMSSLGKENGSVAGANGEIDFSDVFVKAIPFTAGLTITYDDSLITRAKESDQKLAPNIVVGMRLQSAQVVRFCDAKAMQLLSALSSDGRWRIMVFAGDIRQDTVSKKLHQVNHASYQWTKVLMYQLGEYLFSDSGPIQKYLPLGSDIDSFIEVILILSGERLKVNQEQIPECFYPVTGQWRMRGIAYCIHL
ncbi:MAG: hypothetical protein Q9165_008876 [Trypethelium subeluteriae]